MTKGFLLGGLRLWPSRSLRDDPGPDKRHDSSRWLSGGGAGSPGGRARLRSTPRSVPAPIPRQAPARSGHSFSLKSFAPPPPPALLVHPGRDLRRFSRRSALPREPRAARAGVRRRPPPAPTAPRPHASPSAVATPPIPEVSGFGGTSVPPHSSEPSSWAALLRGNTLQVSLKASRR